MKRIFAAAIVFGVLAIPPAWGQQDHHPRPGNGPHPAPAHVVRPAMHRPAFGTVHRSSVHVVTEHRHGTVYRTRVHHVTVVHRGTAVRRVTTRHVTATRNVHMVAARHAADVHALRRNFTAPRRFHRGAYVRPAGWYPHRWVYGERLPVAWYGRSYWIVDFSLFGLVYPPDGYEWIRVGDDALLVDIDTGEIIRVEYGVFY